METTVRKAITRHQGLSYRIMGIFNSHYDQIIRELWIECQKCPEPEDGRVIREFFEEYMEEDMGFPSESLEDFLKEFGVQSDDTTEVKTTPAPNEDEKEEVPESVYNIPIRDTGAGLGIFELRFTYRKTISHSGYVQVKGKELEMGIDTYIKYLASIIAGGAGKLSEQYLCSTFIPDIVERIFTMLYLAKVNNHISPEATCQYIQDTRGLVNTLNARLQGDDIEEKIVLLDPKDVLLDTQGGIIMDYYKNLAELYD